MILLALLPFLTITALSLHKIARGSVVYIFGDTCNGADEKHSAYLLLFYASISMMMMRGGGSNRVGWVDRE